MKIMFTFKLKCGLGVSHMMKMRHNKMFVFRYLSDILFTFPMIFYGMIFL